MANDFFGNPADNFSAPDLCNRIALIHSLLVDEPENMAFQAEYLDLVNKGDVYRPYLA